MAVERNPVINFGALTEEGVVGSGKYTLNELIEMNRQELQRIVSQRDTLKGILQFVQLMQTPDGNDSPEDVAKFNEGVRVAGKRLVRDFKQALSAPAVTPQDIRNQKLQAILDSFEGRDGDSDGKLVLNETGLHADIFNLLDTDQDGKVSPAELSAGISS